MKQVIQMADKLENVFLKVSTIHRIGESYVFLNKSDKALGVLVEKYFCSQTVRVST